MAAVVDNLFAGNNLDSAMAMAKETYGEKDSYLYTEDGALDYAVPTVYCGENYMFAEEELSSLEDGRYLTNDNPIIL